MIKKIQITNVKGIGSGTKNSTVEFDLHPNRPLIFVAPNGFGKSSLSTAFKSLNPTKIILDDDNYFEGNKDNKPQINVTYLNSDNNEEVLIADESSNQLRNTFDWFVINNQIFAKARKSRIGNTVIASASLETPPIILNNQIPVNAGFNYSITLQREKYGQNGKILRNIGNLYENSIFSRKIEDLLTSLSRTNGQRVQEKIQAFNQRVNERTGNAGEIRQWIDNNEIEFLSNINYLSDIANLISTLDLGYDSNADNYLTAVQIIQDYNSNPENFRNAVKRKIYELEKAKYCKVFEDFNSSWKLFKPIEKEGKLIVEIPKNIHISNGQRDVMCFIALLKKAELSLNKQNCVLIIDEVFDYLDDANLIAVQYYITQLIIKFSSSSRKLYPIILTHLNPYFFKNFTFSKQKVFFLDKKDAKISPALKKLLIIRDSPTIKDNVSKYHLHYEPIPINIRPAFELLSLKPTWGDSAVFESFVYEEFKKYINEESVYDPFAVCCAVRKKVENFAYDNLIDPDLKQEFLNTHKTPDKLAYVEDKGFSIPETYYLLGVIYNDGLHWKDNEAAIAGKLENLTIRKMINEIV